MVDKPSSTTTPKETPARQALDVESTQVDARGREKAVAAKRTAAAPAGAQKVAQPAPSGGAAGPAPGQSPQGQVTWTPQAPAKPIPASAPTARETSESTAPSAPAAHGTSIVPTDGRLSRLVHRMEALIGQQVQAAERYRDLLTSATEHLDRLDCEHRALAERATRQAEEMAQRHEESAARLRAERDSLAKELNEQRTRFAEDARANTQAATQLLKRVEQERGDWRQRAEAAKREMSTLRAEISSLQDQLAEALNSRDRVAAHVRTVERKLEEVLMPLRVEVDRRKGEAERLDAELRDARKQIEALQILAKAP